MSASHFNCKYNSYTFLKSEVVIKLSICNVLTVQKNEQYCFENQRTRFYSDGKKHIVKSKLHSESLRAIKKENHIL